MTSRKLMAIAATAGLAAALAVATLQAKDPPKKGDAGREATLEGRIVDLHSFMTGQMMSSDKAKCTADCIRAGVPAGLDTKTGLIIIGEGMKSPSGKLAPLAYEEVKATGKIYERDGVKYMDLVKIEKAGATHATARPHAPAKAKK